MCLFKWNQTFDWIYMKASLYKTLFITEFKKKPRNSKTYWTPVVFLNKIKYSFYSFLRLFLSRRFYLLFTVTFRLLSKVLKHSKRKNQCVSELTIMDIIVLFFSYTEHIHLLLCIIPGIDSSLPVCSFIDC